MGASSWRQRLGKLALLSVPLLGATYGGVWAAEGDPPFFGSPGCPDEAASGSTPSPSPSPSSETPSDGGAGGPSLSFGFEPDPLRTNEVVRWNLSVTNVSQDALTLSFDSGQDGDVVLSQGGTVRYRWSDGRVFTQALRTIELAPGETWHSTLEDTVAVEPGSYELVATVASEPAPTAAQRTVTVGEASSQQPSETPSPSETATPSPTDSPSSTPSASPTDPPSPSAGAAVIPFLPFPLLLIARRISRRRTRPRRTGCGGLWTIALVVVLVAVPLREVDAQEGGSGGKNVVLVMNQTDGRVAARAGLLQGFASGPAAVPENLASASSSCTDCRTVAVALQAVLLISDPDIASPRNAAVAVNGGCTRCQTFAYAWQYVVSTGGPVRITAEGQRTISDLRSDASSLAGSDLPFPELVDELDGVAMEFRAVIDQEVRRVGGQGISERALDVEDDGC